ncbi:MAG: hypothetical protein HRT43_10265, partial [Campylobacteraceae bacterium]|nr:hypothetical protein [Campylobacteraceae bacterium]
MKPIFKYILLLCFLFSFVNAQTKVLYINSYHEGYKSAIIQTNAVKDILLPKNIVLKFVHMNTKQIKKDSLRKLEALKIKKIIQQWKPNLVIASDDAASKYVVKEYYRDAKLPFVFIGVNWSIKSYEYPYSNVTGQIEVELASELIEELLKYADGVKVGFISGNSTTDKKALKHYEKELGMKFHKVEFVKDFAQWKETYMSLQYSVDVLLFRSNSGIKNWDDEKAEEFIKQETKIPTGSVNTSMFQYVLISFAKDNYEFGEYASHTALLILNGASPSDIPITRNQRSKVSLNMTLGKKLNII